jgi:GNAT superfamily N-acetyltransferase
MRYSGIGKEFLYGTQTTEPIRQGGRQKQMKPPSDIRSFYKELGYAREGSTTYYSFPDACRARVIFDSNGTKTVSLELIELAEKRCQGRGHAATLLRRIVKAADTHGITLELIAHPPEDNQGMLLHYLVKWYEKFGFVPLHAEENWVEMRRVPRGAKKNPSYAELSALPAKAYLEPENFVTPFDEGTRRAPTKALNRAREQYEKGLDEGRKGDIHISNQSVWSSKRHDGSRVQSYEGIGYHAHTASLLAGFLASGGKVFVHRRGKGATQIAGPKAAKKNGPTLGKPHYPFAEKEEQYSKYTTSHLYHAMNDAMAASRAQQGWNEAGACWYLDDYHTIVKEIQRRKRMR